MGAISIGSSDPFSLSLVCGEKRTREMDDVRAQDTGTREQGAFFLS